MSSTQYVQIEFLFSQDDSLTKQEAREIELRAMEDALESLTVKASFLDKQHKQHKKEHKQQYKQALKEWREARDLQEAEEMERRAFEDALEREEAAHYRILKKISRDIKKSRNSSTGYLWRLTNNTPKGVTLIEYPEEVIYNVDYLDKLVEVYTDHLANMFRRMIVNKRAVKDSIKNDDIYVVEFDGLRRVMFDLTYTHLDSIVEVENYLPMNGMTEYNNLIHYTVKSGYHIGCSFQEVLSDKLQDAVKQVSGYVQNRHKYDSQVFFTSYCELVTSGNHLIIQAVYEDGNEDC
jgi:hypothetical protein